MYACFVFRAFDHRDDGFMNFEVSSCCEENRSIGCVRVL